MARFFLADDESGVTLLRGPGMAADARCDTLPDPASSAAAAAHTPQPTLPLHLHLHLPGAQRLLPPPVHTSKVLPTCPLPPGELDETAARGLDFVIAEAAKYGIRLTLVLLNLWKARTVLKARRSGVAVGPSRHESACTAEWFGVRCCIARASCSTWWRVLVPLKSSSGSCSPPLPLPPAAAAEQRRADV